MARNLADTNNPACVYDIRTDELRSLTSAEIEFVRVKFEGTGLVLHERGWTIVSPSFFRKIGTPPSPERGTARQPGDVK